MHCCFVATNPLSVQPMYLPSTSSGSAQRTPRFSLRSILHRSPQRQDPTGLASGCRAVCRLLVLGVLGLTSLSAWAQTATVTALSPPRNANTAARATNVTVTLSQPPTSASALTVYSQQAGGKKAGTATVSGNSLTFNPNHGFQARRGGLYHRHHGQWADQAAGLPVYHRSRPGPGHLLVAPPT